ncbi:MAG: GNAT family N-acetyltransferase [Nanobdellota archaeon]
MIITPATSKDIEQCVKLSRIPEFQYPTGEFPDKIYFTNALDNIFLVGKKDKDTIVGLIVGYSLTPDLVYLDLLAVSPSFRGKSLGQRLLSSFRKELEKLNIKDYFLIAPSSNEKTLNFYRKNDLVEGKEYTLFCDKVN